MIKSIDYIVENFSDTVYRVAVSYTGNFHEAEDIVSEVLMKYFERCEQLDFENDEHIKAWLIRTAINLSKDFVKSGRFTKSAQLEDTHSVEFAWSENQIDVENALAKLDEKHRIAVYLYYFEGYSTEEISKLTGTSKGTVTSRLMRARKKLRLMLSDYDETKG